VCKIIYHGGLHGKKRPIHLLIHAIRHVKNKNIKLILAGSDPEHLEKLATSLGVKDRVYFTGFLTHDVLFSILEYCDVGIICMNPKYLDGHVTSFVKLYEYFMFGLPVLATPMKNLEGLDECVEFWRSSRELAAKINEYCKNSDKIQEISKKVKKIAQENNWFIECKSLEDLYRQISRELIR
ncbi:MAG: glycosyltransferase, partial [Candidatus Helarchaeales archaeon]